jgi:ABC-type lipoprotein export system ATPase subunit
VLADEPTGNLDSQSGAEVFEMMREMNRESGVAFVMITHDDRLAQAADRILLIQDGNITEISKDEHRRKMSLLNADTKPQDLDGAGTDLTGVMRRTEKANTEGLE